ncbi:transcriptional regulator, IclR family [Nocardia amikacinitolerans]|uniref:IclR family transcriptional regulator n=1 Tax=Nocardia amikacinitolerans TaxID=756689 RepID=UPI000836801A|nr:IclR family transcriptional regulator [Nocardia amikacinitolerans]MCP2321252.1 transcriptional regulator, IclR family [Nocardia amikacinitolerans]
MTTSIAEPVRDDRAAVDKAISLLIAFGDHAGTGLGVSELARRAQLSKSTAFRVLGMLERNGVVERVGTGYRLGARLHQLGQAVYSPEHEQIRDLLLPFLTDLYEATRHTVHLAALHGTDVVYLAKLYGHRTIAAPSRIGGRLPAHGTAVGKVLLAYRSHTATQAHATPLHALTPHTIIDPARLADELAGIRRTGIAHDNQESRIGLSCLAAPVFDHRGRALAALSIAGPHGQFDTRRLETGLRRICASATKTIVRAQLPRSA